MTNREYLMRILKHKWFVIVANYKYKFGVSVWRLIIHDISKLLPSEFFAYKEYLYTKSNIEDYTLAFTRHVNRNEHHWEYWIPKSGVRKDTPIGMSDQALKEMICDWFAASRVYEGKWPEPGYWNWFYNNYDDIKVNFHADTAREIDAILLGEMGF